MPGYVQVQVAVDDRAKAAELARSAVGARLAACAQIVGPVTSVYRWKGELETAEEFLLLVKTTRERAEALTELIRRDHPYETPEIITLPVDGGLGAYLRWIDEETGSSASGGVRAENG
ncbi:divalent cation tolerance protein [Sphaerisporangium krabiense]|uniref:Periplasmic divalent cation tolerance protein n=1 Tax=Sphaerisporangium krabiense TaxID=763782 RepID=A0A7W8YZM8_9ACTN|nr:divalent-cation tolerance protein CutA [Sphaerisporangium krabiense]MBB5624749.1 periplasmic divalent cation tolerance protein [Sphaerisporangium krabiense]GII61290.1 divalent cation tolerance protein [Sphaerisporangium krabiense]